MTSNYGGVVNFKENVLSAFNELAADCVRNYNVIVADPTHDEISSNGNLTYLHGGSVPYSLGNKLAFYEKHLQEIVRQAGVDILLNFGDIPARVDCKQVFYFDWPYAVYDDMSLWSRMRLNDFGAKAGKRLYFSMTAQRPDTFIVQTQTMKRRLIRKYPKADIRVVDVGFNIGERAMLKCNADVAYDSPVLIYPTAMYPHKNLGILLNVAEVLKSHRFPVKFQLTFSDETGSKEAAFCNEVSKRGLDTYFQFLGRLTREKLVNEIRSATAIIMPTLIETYGLPYLEAQILRKPMFTSRRDFAEELCGEAAFYFDPLDAQDIAKVIMDNINNTSALKAKLVKSEDLVSKRISWPQAVDKINQIILEVVS